MRIFDLTKEIKLQPSLQKKYDTARIILHVVFVFAMLFVAYRILFPIVPLDFNLATPDANKNTLVAPRLGQTNKFPPKRTIRTNETLLFNANPEGQFSDANISFVLGKNTADLESTEIKIRKSYQAFFYPTGDPVGFPNATLLSTTDANYYLVSNGLLRKFSNPKVILSLGYPKSAFINVSTDDLKYNKIGEDITDSNTYPDDTLFAIDNTYYQLKKQQLSPFVSAQAFLSQFDATSAIAKDNDFFVRYPISEASMGFADGTLASSADSVYILSEDKSYPIENEITFAALGFDWGNVIPISADELGAYKKQKQFTNNSPHPNGTILIDQKEIKYFIIKDGKKLPIDNAAIIKTFSKQKPISANLNTAEKEFSCALQRKTFSSNTYSCNISLANFTSFVGNDYQIAATFPSDATLNTIDVTFSTPLTFDSLKNSLSVIKTKLKNRQQ
jgi:hypothetical protein